MAGTNLFIITLHLALLPFIFHILRFLRIEEIFKRHTPPAIITFTYLILTIAITQLVVQYFVTVFRLIDDMF